MSLKNLVYINIVTLVIMNLGNVCNYLFQIMAGRILSPIDFGLFNALNSLAILGSIPVFVLPIVLSRCTVELEANGKEYIARLLWWSTCVLGIVAVVLILTSGLITPGIKEYLNMTTTFPAFLVIVYIATNLVRPAPWGVLQGLERFTRFSIVGGGSSFVRLLAGVLLLVVFNYRVNGALWAGIISNIFGWALAVWFLRDIVGGKTVRLPEGTVRNMFKFALPASLANAFLLMFGNLDMILAKHFCPPDVVGLYASASVFGKIAFYLASVLGNVLFPKIAKGDHSSLTVCLVLTGLLAGGVSLLSFFAGDTIASLLFGEAYATAGPLFKVITFGMSFLAMVNVFIVYGLARQKYQFLWIQAIGVAVLVVSIYANHESAMDIALSLSGASATMLVGTIIWFFRLPKSIPHEI